jgi:hypothetical protein
LKKVIEQDFAPTTDRKVTWELSDEVLAAIWITVKGDLVAIDQCIDDFMLSLTGLDVWFGGFNVVHYTHGLKALLMNCKLKGHWPYLVNSSQIVADVTGVTFPILFGAPYLNDQMALPRSLSNRKKLDITFDATTAALTELLIDISEVILPDANPTGCIKQEEQAIESKGTGDHDLWLQTNWDLLKLILQADHVPTGAVYTKTINRAGMEIDDFSFGYQNVPWEILHGEMMDELEGSGPVEDHQHLETGTGAGVTGMPKELEHWISHYAEMDFFYNHDLKWKAPLSIASTAKLKYNAGVAEAWNIITANYVPNSKL